MALNEMRWKAASLDDARIQLERATTAMQEQAAPSDPSHAASAERLVVIERSDQAVREFQDKT